MTGFKQLKTAPRQANEIRYSRGCSTYDNCPKQCVASSFPEFTENVLADKSPLKGLAYICSPLLSGMHDRHEKYPGCRPWRIKSLIEPVRFVVFDIDGFSDPKDFERLVLMLASTSGFAYETASSTPELPRARVVLELSRPLGADDRQRVSVRGEMAIKSSLGVDVANFDRSVYVGCQPFYTPVGDPASYVFDGQPIDVDFYLNEVVNIETSEAPPHTASVSIIETPLNVQRLNRALSFVSSDVERSEWMRIVWSVRAHGWKCGESIARDWSKTAPDRFDEAGFQNVWQSFNPDREPRITTQEIYDRATHLGWQDEAPDQRLPAFEFVHLGTVIKDPPVISWVVEGVIPEDSVLFLVGDPKSGKSLIAFDWAACIATGDAWRGRRTNRGGVLILAGEGQHGIIRRMLAISEHFQRSLLNAPIGFSRTGGRLCDEKGLADVIEAAENFEHEYGPIRLIIIDTLHRNMGGADENSAADMSRYFDHIDQLRHRFNASVMTVHHSGHGAKERARGSSAIMAGVDVLYLMSENKKASSEACKVVTLACDKNKDGEELRDQHFEIVPVALPLQPGQMVPQTSVVLESHSGDPLIANVSLTEMDKVLISALQKTAANDGVYEEDALKTAFVQARLAQDPEIKTNTISQSFGRTIDHWLGATYMDRAAGDGYRLTPKGVELTRRRAIQS